MGILDRVRMEMLLVTQNDELEKLFLSFIFLTRLSQNGPSIIFHSSMKKPDFPRGAYG